jgi:hypothetical protein
VLLNSADGQPYKGTTASSVSLLPTNVIDQFRDAVKSKYSNTLSSIDAAQLQVYKNKSSFDAKEVPLKSSHPLDCLGETEEDALIVVVPSKFFSSW